jgi:NADP-dependent 3-hydroxy acid dehydrogenase YdfG
LPQGVNPGVVRTDLYEASGMSADEVERLFAKHAAMRPENVAEAVEYALATPIDVQVHKQYLRGNQFCIMLIFGYFAARLTT